MIQHIDSWFAFAQDRGHDIDRMEEIILVTGCHHTRSWANVIFLENQAPAQASFGVKVAHDTINWKFSLGEAHGAVCGWGPEGRLRVSLQEILISRILKPITYIRTCGRTNAYLSEGSVLSAPLEYSQSNSKRKQDPIHVLMERAAISQTGNSHRYLPLRR
jgi:hypothetical protein